MLIINLNEILIIFYFFLIKMPKQILNKRKMTKFETLSFQSSLSSHDPMNQSPFWTLDCTLNQNRWMMVEVLGLSQAQLSCLSNKGEI